MRAVYVSVAALAVTLAVTSGMHAQQLSLIHISEPTRPY